MNLAEAIETLAAARRDALGLQPQLIAIGANPGLTRPAERVAGAADASLELVEQAARHGMPVKARAAAVEAIASADYPTAARRPHNSRLDASCLEQAFGLTLPPWQQGVDAVVAGAAWLASPRRRGRPRA